MNYNYKRMVCGGVVAGALIACAGAASTLAAASFPFLKALIFPFGLLLICYGKFELFTGNIYKIGGNNTFSEDNKFGLLTTNYISNFIGAFLVSQLIKVPAEAMLFDKIGAGVWRIFLLAIACNFLVCLGVKLFKTSPLATYLCVALFVACGFEHSIADMYYFCCLPFDPLYVIGAFSVLMIVTCGNIIGGWLVIKLERILEI